VLAHAGDVVAVADVVGSNGDGGGQEEPLAVRLFGLVLECLPQLLDEADKVFLESEL
jgi:hypothetical protein